MVFASFSIATVQQKTIVYALALAMPPSPATSRNIKRIHPPAGPDSKTQVHGILHFKLMHSYVSNCLGALGPKLVIFCSHQYSPRHVSTYTEMGSTGSHGTWRYDTSMTPSAQ